MDLLLMQVFKLTITTILIFSSFLLKAHEAFIMSGDETYKFIHISPNMHKEIKGVTIDFISDSLLTGNNHFNLYLNKYSYEKTILPMYKNTLFLIILKDDKPYFSVYQIDSKNIK